MASLHPIIKPLAILAIVVVLSICYDSYDCSVKGKMGNIQTELVFGTCYVSFKGVSVPYNEYVARSVFSK